MYFAALTKASFSAAVISFCISTSSGVVAELCRLRPVEYLHSKPYLLSDGFSWVKLLFSLQEVW